MRIRRNHQRLLWHILARHRRLVVLVRLIPLLRIVVLRRRSVVLLLLMMIRRIGKIRRRRVMILVLSSRLVGRHARRHVGKARVIHVVNLQGGQLLAAAPKSFSQRLLPQTTRTLIDGLVFCESRT